MFNTSMFSNNKPSIDKGAEVIFVSDFFAEEYPGGAELTSEALIKSSPKNIQKIKSKDVSIDLLEKGQNCHWIFGNFSQMNLQLIPTIIANNSYSVLEYDYKFCAYRSVEKHLKETGNECDCSTNDHGIVIATFYASAKSIWWMSEGQKNIYEEKFPFLKEHNCSIVLSSVFDDEYFLKIKELNAKSIDSERKGWVVLGSDSWIKGKEDAINWCEENNKEYEVIWGLSYEQTLEKLSKSKGFVYLPRGNDTCPRMVIEAKMLGCQLELNEFVQHKDELWFDTKDKFDTEAYLYGARDRFWNAIISVKDTVETVSALSYIEEANYSKEDLERNIKCLSFCSQIILGLRGSDEFIKEVFNSHEAENVTFVKSNKRKYLRDLLEKTEGNYVWVFDQKDYYGTSFAESMSKLVRSFPIGYDALELPYLTLNSIEDKKLLLSEKPVKIKMFRNRKDIAMDDSGNLIYLDGKHVNFATFFTEDIEKNRLKMVEDDLEKITDEEKQLHDNFYQWLQAASESLPTVYRFENEV